MIFTGFFVFTHKKTLKQIRWRHFLSDCNALVADDAQVEKLLAEEIDRANVWLGKNYRDIQENFDPAVIKLKKKNKIVMTGRALEDISTIDADKE